MNTDLLQQLKSLELPPEPALWPPAPGWWFVFACVLGCAGWAAMRLRQRHTLAGPRRSANAELAQLRLNFQAGKLSASTYVDEVNELLKRLLRRYQPTDAALTAFGVSWLTYLDELTNSEGYSAGPGRVLGTDRYRRDVDADWPAFDALIDKTISRIGQ